MGGKTEGGRPRVLHVTDSVHSHDGDVSDDDGGDDEDDDDDDAYDDDGDFDDDDYMDDGVDFRSTRVVSRNSECARPGPECRWCASLGPLALV
eukprot:4520614-Pyramimonas_sp.AAC.1